jgi:hypothetical protein
MGVGIIYWAGAAGFFSSVPKILPRNDFGSAFLGGSVSVSSLDSVSTSSIEVSSTGFDVSSIEVSSTEFGVSSTSFAVSFIYFSSSTFGKASSSDPNILPKKDSFFSGTALAVPCFFLLFSFAFFVLFLMAAFFNSLIKSPFLIQTFCEPVGQDFPPFKSLFFFLLLFFFFEDGIYILYAFIFTSLC